MTRIENIGLAVPEIYLPNSSVDPNKWAVIACDQFTSQPEYWERVAAYVDGAPSTFHMILPEVWLHSEDIQQRIAATQKTMRAYLDDGIFDHFKGFVLVERTIGERKQTGLVVALDLEAYDYTKGAQTLIRATEGTILNRLPPRMQVRRGAPLELPHILVLYDDPCMRVLSEVLAAKAVLPQAYDFELMEGSGHLKGYRVEEERLLDSVQNALSALIEPATYDPKYDLPEGTAPLLFAMGDGNHSLATAKAIWEELKPTVGMDHPARYALVELVNLHDPSLQFEPIHRVLFNTPETFLSELRENNSPNLRLLAACDLSEVSQLVNENVSPNQRFGVISPAGYAVVELTSPKQNLPVGNLQEFLDAYLASHPGISIDYVHGDEIVDELGRKPGNVGFYLPPIGKDSFFKTVILDGALPRKTFSMGHAKDKRFYMECRRISA
ncbi:MAG TPA: DUF1015 domain-containing protein [Anaerolineaceae bacterium]|jgi:hypothetical protein|nr:DUF1015 domain-containing protein [Anaerolineaceae bacterium]HPT23457.1 DUF1015 domain-containing protein [Anaerolineaceae bacterium]